MKIKEIIVENLNEGPFDTLKNVTKKAYGGIKGAKQSFQTSQAQRESSEYAIKIGKQVYERWAAQQGRLRAAGLNPNDPNVMKQWLTRFLKGYEPTQNPPADVSNSKESLNYIIRQTAGYLAAQSQGTLHSHMSQNTPDSTIDAKTAIDQFRKIHQNVGTSAHQSHAVEVPPGERLVITNPKTGGKYYKTQAGWVNELNQKIESPTALAKLEQIADTGGAKMEVIPVVTQQSQKIQRKGKRR